MKEVEKLKLLVFEAKVQINVLAQFCNCAPSTIYNYANGLSTPHGAKLLAIKEGMKKYQELINTIMEE